MSLRTLKITKKELQNYYGPLTSDFERMVNSVNSVMGFGQVIQRYIGLEVLNTYYHVWDNNLGEEVVIDKTSLSYYPEAQAGPMLWSVSSQEGLNFLNGVSPLPGYRKYKYCNGCSDKNTIAFQSVDNFKKRFSQVSSLIGQYGTLDAYLFYDDSLPRFTNVYPAVKYDDGVNVNFYFKNIEGTDKSLTEIQQITGKPISEIEISIDEAPIVKPQEGANSIIVSCCDERISYVVSGQMRIGATITLSSYLDGSKSWYVESYTNDEPTFPEGITFTYGERSCASGIFNNPCGGGLTSSSVNSCCPGENGIIEGVYPVGTVLYTKDTDPAGCYVVVGNGTDEPTMFYRFSEFRGDCKMCSNDYPGFCK